MTCNLAVQGAVSRNCHLEALSELLQVAAVHHPRKRRRICNRHSRRQHDSDKNDSVFFHDILERASLKRLSPPCSFPRPATYIIGKSINYIVDLVILVRIGGENFRFDLAGRALGLSLFREKLTLPVPCRPCRGSVGPSSTGTCNTNWYLCIAVGATVTVCDHRTRQVPDRPRRTGMVQSSPA